jgi:hypothetical protein
MMCSALQRLHQSASNTARCAVVGNRAKDGISGSATSQRYEDPTELQRLLSLVCLMIILVLAPTATDAQGGPNHKSFGSEQWSEAIEKYIKSYPNSPTDIDGVAGGLHTVTAAFDYVRDNVALEAYPGLMKGPAATLSTKGGNDLDRAILLATLLQKQGFAAKIAKGRLTAQQAATLYNEILVTTDARDRIDAASRPAFGQRASGFLSRMKSFSDAKYADLIKAAINRAEALKRQIPMDMNTNEGSKNSLLAIISTHYWLRVEQKGETIDLDPSFPEAKAGDVFCSVENLLDFDRVSEETAQKVEFTVTADYLKDGNIVADTVLSVVSRSSDLWDSVIRFTMYPNSTASARQPMIATEIRIGDKRVSGRPFGMERPATTNETPHTAPMQGFGFGLQQSFGGTASGLLGGKSTGGLPDDKKTARLVRVRLGVTSKGPGLAPETWTRTVFDRLDRQGPHFALSGDLTADAAALPLLIQNWDGAVSFGAVHPVYLAKVVQRWLAAQRSLKALADSKVEISGRQTHFPDPELPAEVAMMLDRSARLGSDLAQRSGKLKEFYSRPRLAFLRHGYQVSDLARRTEPRTFQEGIDLINAPVTVIGDPPAAASLALDWGSADADLEGGWSLSRPALSAIALLSQADIQQLPLHSITKEQIETLSGLPLWLQDVLRQEIDNDNAVLGPSVLIDTPRGHHYAWWAIDRKTGFPIGKADFGGGQALTEYRELYEIYEPQIASLQYIGNIDRCYFSETISSLSGGPANDEELHHCLKEASCEMLAELMAQISFALPEVYKFFDQEELGELEEIIENLNEMDPSGVYGEWASSWAKKTSGANVASAVCVALQGD